MRDPNSAELRLKVSSSGNSLNRLAILTSNRGATLRAVGRLHRHTTFSYREWVSVCAVIPMACTLEILRHCCVHGRLFLVCHRFVEGRITQHLLHILSFSKHASSLAEVFFADCFGLLYIFSCL